MKKAFYFLLAAICLSVVLNIWQCSRQPQESTVIEHDTVWKDTTIYEPQPAETVQTGRVVYIKVPVPGERDTITVHDSIEVPIPIVQKRYDDSLYTAWVSGFEPNLDSIRLYHPEIITTVTKTIVKPSPRLMLGPSVGVGYGLYHKTLDVYVGFNLTWNIWKR